MNAVEVSVRRKRMSAFPKAIVMTIGGTGSLDHTVLKHDWESSVVRDPRSAADAVHDADYNFRVATLNQRSRRDD